MKHPSCIPLIGGIFFSIYIVVLELYLVVKYIQSLYIFSYPFSKEKQGGIKRIECEDKDYYLELAHSLTCCLATRNSELASCWLATLMRNVLRSRILETGHHHPVNVTESVHFFGVNYTPSVILKGTTRTLCGC